MTERKYINTDWLFARKGWDQADPASQLKEGIAVSLPHTWYEDGDYYRGDAVYQKSFRVYPDGEKCYFLKFHGVDKICEIFVNGQKVGRHEGGYSMFALDITDAVKAGEGNLLTVFVNNEQGDSVNPIFGDFTIFGGIYRTVELITCEPVHFDYAYYGTDGVEINTETKNGVGTVHVKVHLSGAALAVDQETFIVCHLQDAEGREAAACRTADYGNITFSVDEPILWNGQSNPYLYTVTVELWSRGILVDTVQRSCGFRTLSFDPEKGFFLNEEYLKLKGVAKHQDAADCYSAATEEQWDTDMALIEEIGANAVRLSHYQHPQYIYDKCDSMGFVVWAEIPMLRMTEKEALFENAKIQLKELILQNAHHPSIVMWGVQNEIAMFGEQPYLYENVSTLHRLARELDPYRVTTSANLNTVPDDSTMNKITDVVAYNLYYGWYYGEMKDLADRVDEFHKCNPDIPFGISEYGADCNLAFHSAEPKVKDYTEEFSALFHETAYPILQSRDFIWGSFVWNMFDFVSGVRNEGGIRYRNSKGLVTHDRKTRKDSFYYYKAVWSKLPFVHIAEKRFVNRAADTMNVKVYSNCGQVTISVNGTEYLETPQNGICLVRDVALQDGENIVTAKTGNCIDETIFRKVAKSDESYVFVDPNPGINVKNWFTDAVEMEKLFPKDAYSIRDTVDELLANEEVRVLLKRDYPRIFGYMKGAIGSSSLEVALSYAKTICDEKTGKELNGKLTKIKK